jgi:MFS family permease
MFLPFNYLPVFGQAHGMSTDMANYLIAVLNAASVFGRLSGGLGDKIGRFNWMICITAMSGILVFALWLPGTGSIPTIFFAALYGFSTGAFVSLAPALTAQISDIREIGLRNGALFMVCSLAALTGDPIGGALLSKYDGGFRGLQIFTGCVIMAGVVVFTLARVKLAGASLRTVV